MNGVAKLVITYKSDSYLVLQRNAHRVFGFDPDLPGGTMETGEQPIDTLVREVYEEIGLVVDERAAVLMYSGSGYSGRNAEHYLFSLDVSERPSIILSPEHTSFDWVNREEFLLQAKNAKDEYMHMVYGVLS